MLRPLRLIGLTLAPLMLWAGSVAAQVQEAVSAEITIRGTIESVDLKTRTVHIRGEQGNLITVDVPESATRLDQVHAGDTVTASYYDRVMITPKPAGEPAVDRRIPPTAAPSPGSLPGGTLATQRVATVTVTGWDATNRVISFRIPSGESYSRRLLDTTDASIASGLKAGDRYDVTWTEAVRFAVQPAPDTLRNRLTFSVLWGIDNSISGHMIKDAAGRTTTGVPINLTETSYDDVYGRVGLLKIGAGYRLTPRTEADVNFVYAKSGSQRVQIGTAGTVPLTVDFTDYQYWGLEAGQRWFFARTRFTPFVGYLVGLNRHQDIRGTFVNVPASSTPGLAEQDGKFFEKSWALSLGPTAGFLVGIGPVEAMIETQLRYLGGLSDVDWLVEEGLRDINSESGRWSIPVQVGVRLRF